MHLRNSNEGVEWAVLQSVAKKNLTSKSCFFYFILCRWGRKTKCPIWNTDSHNLFFLPYLTCTLWSSLFGTPAGWNFLLLNKQNKHGSLFHFIQIFAHTLLYLFGFEMWVISELIFDQNLVPKLFINVIYSPWTLFLTLFFSFLLFPNTLIRSGEQ